MIDYLDHCGFDVTTLARPPELPAAWLGHYRIQNRVYDVHRACCDLSEWPPIASAIVKRLNAK